MRVFMWLAAMACLPAAAAEFNAVDTARSRLEFTYRQMGVPMEGRFGRFAVQLAFDPDRATAAKATMEVELASIDTGSAEGNDEIAGKQWFDTRAFPTARFVSTGVKALGNGRYEAVGKLTIKGRSQDVAAPFVFSAQGNIGTFDGTFTVKRADFSIGEGPWADFGTVANEIRIEFHILAKAGR